MAIKKKEVPPPSCPMWLATYGDLVTNMLVFFVLLVSMSEIKQDDKLEAVVDAIQEAFGFPGGLNQMPLELEQILNVKNAPLPQFLVMPIDPLNMGKSHDSDVIGKHETVTRPRPPERYDRGGKFDFTELSTELSPAEQAKVADYAEKVRGLRTQIEVRGHCSKRPVEGTAYANHFQLAYARAEVVKDALVRAGIDERRIILVAAGTNEPVTSGNYTPTERQWNDIVEILQIDKSIDEYGTEPAGDPSAGPW